MQNLKSVDVSTQVGSEEKKSSQRERKVFEDEVLPDYEDDCYDSVAVYGEDDDENDDDDWKERSFEEVQELISDSENPSKRKESESSPVKVNSERPLYLFISM